LLSVSLIEHKQVVFSSLKGYLLIPRGGLSTQQ
jgi:hypothetical protein